jgi:AcrR family transcriptional regulator
MIKGMKQKMVKDAIITEAKKQFLAKGVQKTTLRSIAKELGMAIGNLYYYYKSKSDICLVIWHTYTNDYIREFSEKMSDSGEIENTGLEAIRKYYADLFVYCRQNSLYVELIAYCMQEKPRQTGSDPAIDELASEAGDNIRTTLVALYQRGIRDGSITAPIANVLYEAWSFNIAYIAIIINVIRYNEIDDCIYEYYINTYLERLACH